jgi:hypothetical protein
MAYHIEGKNSLTKVMKDGVQLEKLDMFELTVKMDGYCITYSQGANLKTEGGLGLEEVTGRLESGCYVVKLGPAPHIMHKINVSDQYGQAPMQEELLGRVQEAVFSQSATENDGLPRLELKISFM